MTIEFFVPGIPVAKGSHRAFVIPGTNRAVVTGTNPAKAKPWASSITTLAVKYKPPQPWDGPIHLNATFYLPPPKSLPKTTPSWPIKKPDADKLLRFLKDCLTGVFYHDDAQVISVTLAKHYSVVPGVLVEVTQFCGQGFVPSNE